MVPLTTLKGSPTPRTAKLAEASACALLGRVSGESEGPWPTQRVLGTVMWDTSPNHNLGFGVPYFNTFFLKGTLKPYEI